MPKTILYLGYLLHLLIFSAPTFGSKSVCYYWLFSGKNFHFGFLITAQNPAEEEDPTDLLPTMYYSGISLGSELLNNWNCLQVFLKISFFGKKWYSDFLTHFKDCFFRFRALYTFSSLGLCSQSVFMKAWKEHLNLYYLSM